MPIKIKELKQLIKREKKAIKLLNNFFKIDWWFATYGNGVPALWEVIEEAESKLASYQKQLRELKGEKKMTHCENNSPNNDYFFKKERKNDEINKNNGSSNDYCYMCALPNGLQQRRRNSRHGQDI